MTIPHRLYAPGLRSIALVAAVCAAAPMPARAQLAYSTVHEFEQGPGGVKGRLIQAADGHIYGTASEGGLYSSGLVFVMRRGPNGWLPPVTLHDFHPSEGIKPLAGLTEGAPGILYGTTSEGGARGGGTLFALLVTGQFYMLHALNPATDGTAITAELTRAPDGSFYGTASAGGPNDDGTIFKISASGVFSEDRLTHQRRERVGGRVPTLALGDSQSVVPPVRIVERKGGHLACPQTVGDQQKQRVLAPSAPGDHP